jgi:hypothetical protein
MKQLTMNLINIFITMTIFFFIIIFGVGFVAGMYVATQIKNKL